MKYFSSGIFQNYLVFIPDKKYIKYFSGTTRINSWKNQTALLHQLLLIIMYYQAYILINKNIYISYILNQWPRDLNTDFTLLDL